MSAIGRCIDLRHMAQSITFNDSPTLDPIAKLKALEGLRLVLAAHVPYVNEFNRSSAEQYEHDVQQWCEDARKAVPEDAWAAAVGHAMTAGPGNARIADLTVLWS
jgi:hypothetical protein